MNRRVNNSLISLALIFSFAVSASAQAPPPAGPSTPAQEGSKLYETAMSQYRNQKWKEAQPLLEKFIAAYPAHEYVPTAYIQLAWCRLSNKEDSAAQQSIDDAINRFYGSNAWPAAYSLKLEIARNKKDNDGYLTILDAMLKQCEEAPYRVYTNIWQYWGGDYNTPPYGAYYTLADYTGLNEILERPNFSTDILAMADKPERAEKALRLLNATFTKNVKELPPDWQYLHVALLRRADKAEQSQKAFADYVAGWSDDPRVIGLYKFEIEDANARKDPKAADELFEKLLKVYPGSATMEQIIAERLNSLAAQDRYDDFCKLAREFFKSYPTYRWYTEMMGTWYTLAYNAARKDDFSRVDSTIAALDEYAGKHPIRQRSALFWKMELLNLQKKYDKAVELAGEVLSDKHWCAEHVDTVLRYAQQEPAYAKAIDAARQKWKIPTSDPTSKALPLLEQLKTRLKADETRHAEELGEEMFSKYPQDAATIEAVKTLCDYYFAKVLVEPRDKWMARMVEKYPNHPLTQAVLANQITAEAAAQQNDRMAKALDTLFANFPANLGSRHWTDKRFGCYDTAKDLAGKESFAHRVYQDRAAAGELEALSSLMSFVEKPGDENLKANGDLWLAKAKEFSGTRVELYCMERAWTCFYGFPFLYRRNTADIDWAKAKTIADYLRKQTLDPEIPWRLKFIDANFAAEQGQGTAAVKALDEALKEKTCMRDLSYRLDFLNLGRAMEKASPADGQALIKRLKKDTISDRDEHLLLAMQGGLHYAAKEFAAAADLYLKFIEKQRYPAQYNYFFKAAVDCLAQAKSPRIGAEFDKYIKSITRVQDLVPEVMYQQGAFYVGAKDGAAMNVRKLLDSKYPASMARDKMDQAMK